MPEIHANATKKVIDQILPVWNPRHLYLGGGNAKHLTIDLPSHITITPNVAGLLGGIVLWHDRSPDRSPVRAPSPPLTR